MLRPTVVSFLDVATRSADFTLRLEEATIDQRSPIAGRSLAEAAIPKETGLLVIAVRKKAGEDGRFVFNAVGDTRLEARGKVGRAFEGEGERRPCGPAPAS